MLCKDAPTIVRDLGLHLRLEGQGRVRPGSLDSELPEACPEALGKDIGTLRLLGEIL